MQECYKNLKALFFYSDHGERENPPGYAGTSVMQSLTIYSTPGNQYDWNAALIFFFLKFKH